MSLLTRGKHRVLVQHRENLRNERGQKSWQNVGAPVGVRCAVQPVREWSTSEEQFEAGIQMLDLRRIFSKTWPGNVNSHVMDGSDLFETVGAPQHNKMSRATSHWAVTVRWIGSVGTPVVSDGLDFLARPLLVVLAGLWGIANDDDTTTASLIASIREHSTIGG